MTELPSISPVAAVIGALIGAAVAATGATAAAWVWRRWGRRDPLIETGLAIVGLIGTASVLTVGLLLGWRVPLAVLDDAPTLGHPLFAASLLGTVGGHVAVLAWARGLGSPVALTRPSPRWVLVGVAAGGAALAFSALWSRTAELFGRPLADQALVASLLDASPGPGRVAALLFVVAGAPLLEELVFRGYVQTALAARFGAAVGIGAAATLFGLFHLSDPAVVPILAVIGGLLGWVRHRSGSVWPAMVGHLVNNVAAMAIALA